MNNNDTYPDDRLVTILMEAEQELLRVADSLDRGDCLKAKSAARKLRLDANKAWRDIADKQKSWLCE